MTTKQATPAFTRARKANVDVIRVAPLTSLYFHAETDVYQIPFKKDHASVVRGYLLADYNDHTVGETVLILVNSSAISGLVNCAGRKWELENLGKEGKAYFSMNVYELN